MARTLTCDICKRPTDEIAGKMFLSPVVNGAPKSSHHNHYQMHLDVGVCCIEKIKRGFNWTERISAQTYHDNRRRSSQARKSRA